MLSEKERHEKLQALNAKCRECIESRQKRFLPINRSACHSCSIGLQVHELDNPAWNEADHQNGAMEGLFEV